MRACVALLMVTACGGSTVTASGDGTGSGDGSDDGATSSTGEEPYVPCTPSPFRGAWTELTPMTVGRHEPTVSRLGTDVFVLGGSACGDDGPSLASVERLAPDGAWSSLAPMPAGREAGVALELDDGLLVLGGHADSEPNREVLRYDLATDAWSVVSAFPFDTPRPIAVRLDDGTILAYEGSYSTDEVWQVSTDDGQTWQNIDDGPDTRGDYRMALLAMPGGQALFTQAWYGISVYDPATGWTRDSSFEPSLGAAAWLDDTTILVMRATPTDEQFPQGTTQYEPCGTLHATGDTTAVGFTRCPRTTGHVEQYDARAWGASSGTVVVNLAFDWVATYDREQGWARLPDDPVATEGWTAIAETDGSLLVVGGCDAGDGKAVRRWSP